MKAQDLANIFKRLGDAHYQAADELISLIEQPGLSSRPAAPEAGAVPPAPATSSDVDHDLCPKHLVPWTHGTYGPYCKEQTDDPAWGKAKGDRMWCKLTPKNAPAWVQMHGRAA